MSRQIVLRVLLTTALLGFISLFPLRNSVGQAEDYIQDYCSAQAWLKGEDPYQDLLEMRRTSGFDGPGNIVAYNPHPPLAVLLTVPFSYLSFYLSWRVQQGVQLFVLAIAWNWAGKLFGYRSWRFSALGGLTVLWAPIWQGLDWGQPVGIIAFLAVMLWALARDSRPVLCGVGLCAACLIRPFFFLISAVAITWSLKRFMIAALAALATTFLMFAVIGVWPWTWMEKAAEAGQFSVLCGSIPGVLGLNSKIGMVLFFAMLIPVALVRSRANNPDLGVAMALTQAMLTYTHAWFQYDVSLLPVVIWIVSRTPVDSERSNGNQRLALRLAFLYIVLRALPSMATGSSIELWIQVIGRSMLLIAAWLTAEDEDRHSNLEPTETRDGPRPPESSLSDV